MRFFRSERLAGPPPRLASFCKASTDNAVGPTHAAAPGYQGHPSKLRESLAESAPSIHRRSRNTHPDSRPVWSTVQVSARERSKPWVAGGSNKVSAVTQVLSRTDSRGA